MSQAAPILREIKSIFNNQGINNDVQIASHLGFLLLVHERWEDIQRAGQFDLERLLTELHRELEERVRTTYSLRGTLPQSPTQHLRGNNLYEIERITWVLMNALAASHWHDVGDFFQYEIRFEILKDVRRESYPTPHHIADFIAALGANHTEAPIKVLDPAAGTSGLLAAALRYAPNAALSGCDFDPNVAEVGVANLLLHNPPGGIEFHQDSSFTAIRQWDASSFDSVLMNPPFGGTRSAAEAGELIRDFFHEDYGRSVHALLAGVALYCLRPGGQAAFLLPTGSLFGSGGEERLRRILLERHNLQAVITLEKELFQPYSGVASHLVVVQKADNRVNSAAALWFGAVTRDGYPTGAGRDLTAQQDPATNELPRMRDLVLRTRTANWELSLTVAAATHLRALLLQPKGGLPGVALVKEGPATIAWQISALPSGILATIGQANTPDAPDATLLAQLYLPYQTGTAIVLLPEQSTEVNWIAQIPADWSPALSLPSNAKWQGDTETITAELESDSILILKSGRSTTYRFQQKETPDTAPLACLTSSEGQPITPWFTLATDSNTPSLQADDFAEKFAALPLMDATQAQCGWVMNLSAQTGNDEIALPSGVLLILFAHNATLYHNAAANEQVALLPDGWLRVTAQGMVYVEVGERVRLREDIETTGFAIGPTPTGSSESYRVFAAAVPKAALFDEERDRVESFEPRRFLPEPPTAEVGQPSAIIADIRKNQARLGLQVDLLLNLLGSATQREQSTVTPESLHPLVHLLEAKQQHFWQQLQARSNVTDSSRYFTADDLQTDLSATDYSADFIRQQLELFLRMGLIEAVHIGERNLYRLSAAASGELAS
ncbi:MAG: N-6 DNA methylase [Caldilineaceae bacterium]